MLQRYRTMNTARPRVEHLREFLGGWPVEADHGRRRAALPTPPAGAEAPKPRRSIAKPRRSAGCFNWRSVAACSSGCRYFPTVSKKIRRATASLNIAEYLKVRAHAPRVLSGRARLRVLLGLAPQ